VTIIESADNENALVAPVIRAVDSVMTRRPEWTKKGSEWLDAFDHLPPLMTIL
jgi:predicted patatin/cPLA2 family phospholipase